MKSVGIVFHFVLKKAIGPYSSLFHLLVYTNINLLTLLEIRVDTCSFPKPSEFPHRSVLL